MSLADFADPGHTPARVAKLVEVPTLTQRPLNVLAFDQTIAKTGWAYVIFIAGSPILKATGTIVQEATGIKGYEDYLVRAMTLRREINAVYQRVATATLLNLDVVHEAPPMGGGKLNKPESSLTAAVVVRLTCPGATSVHARHARKVLTGNVNADKKQVREALFRYWPSFAEIKPMNYDISDAIALAITHATKEA